MIPTAAKALFAIVLVVVSFGCATTGPASGPSSGPSRVGTPSSRSLGRIAGDASGMYLKEGLFASSGPVPFVGRIAFFGGQSTDSTLAVISVSMASRALSFARDGDSYRAGYSVVADLRSQSGSLRRVVEANEAVRVTSALETQRNEESIIFQRFFPVLPGTYQVSLSVRDAAGGKVSSYEGSVTVPDTRAQGISTPLVVHQAEIRSSYSTTPKIVASPRATGVFGRDSVILTYVETYGNDQNRPVRYSLVSETGSTLWTDSAKVTGSPQVSGGLIRIPVTGVGVGVGHLRIWLPGSRDTVQTPLFVGFGDELPVASFSDMLNYLRFYMNSQRLQAMRTAADDQKAAMWTSFLRDTDPVASTPQHEGLIAYFDRIRIANDRYRGELVDGWLSDRGKVFVTLGEADQYSTPQDVYGRVRSLIWEYRRYSLRLLFQDRSGLNRWELDPSSEAQFNAIAERERVG